jgi:uridine kinase
MESIIKPETRPKTLTLPGYRKHLRQHVASVETITLLPSDIIIVEGVLALYLANLFNASYQFFIRLDESIRRERLVREYIQRGFSPIESEKIYNARLEEEVPLIENQTANAQTINALPY